MYYRRVLVCSRPPPTPTPPKKSLIVTTIWQTVTYLFYWSLWVAYNIFVTGLCPTLYPWPLKLLLLCKRMRCFTHVSMLSFLIFQFYEKFGNFIHADILQLNKWLSVNNDKNMKIRYAQLVCSAVMRFSAYRFIVATTCVTFYVHT